MNLAAVREQTALPSITGLTHTGALPTPLPSRQPPLMPQPLAGESLDRRVPVRHEEQAPGAESSHDDMRNAPTTVYLLSRDLRGEISKRRKIKKATESITETADFIPSSSS